MLEIPVLQFEFMKPSFCCPLVFNHDISTNISTITVSPDRMCFWTLLCFDVFSWLLVESMFGNVMLKQQQAVGCAWLPVENVWPEPLTTVWLQPGLHRRHCNPASFYGEASVCWKWVLKILVWLKRHGGTVWWRKHLSIENADTDTCPCLLLHLLTLFLIVWNLYFFVINQFHQIE